MTATRECPFCGCDDIQDWGENGWGYPSKFMMCTNCLCRGPSVRMRRDDSNDAFLQRAIEAWNDRIPAPPAAVGVV